MARRDLPRAAGVVFGTSDAFRNKRLKIQGCMPSARPAYHAGPRRRRRKDPHGRGQPAHGLQRASRRIGSDVASERLREGGEGPFEPDGTIRNRRPCAFGARVPVTSAISAGRAASTDNSAAHADSHAGSYSTPGFGEYDAAGAPSSTYANSEPARASNCCSLRRLPGWARLPPGAGRPQRGRRGAPRRIGQVRSPG